MTGSYHIGAHAYEATGMPPGLYLVATPIGNLGDITLRALQTLAGCTWVYCEDTRVTGKLLERYGIRTPMRNYHEHNAAKVRPDIVAAIEKGAAVALVSDAGTPLISDPGFKLVAACVDGGLLVTSMPGASAVLTGLQLSALPTDRFAFQGFMPEKESQRLKALQSIKSHTITSVYYESPHRVLATLIDISAVLGDRPVVAARELSKLHEEVLRGPAMVIHATLAARASIKGEFVLVIGPAKDVAEPPDDAAIEAAIVAALENLPASKAAATVAKALRLPKQDIYARILKRKIDGANQA